MMLIQLTGLSGAGKTTIANMVKASLEAGDIAVKIIDGDEYRKTLCKDLGFSKEDRHENIRRLGKAADDFSHQGYVSIISAINPYEEIRQELKKLYKAKTIWINCPITQLIQRDTKGLYHKAMLPDNNPLKIHNLSGINDTYEIPVSADLIINTESETPDESARHLTDFILKLVKS